MPSLLHETLLLLFRNRPDLAPELVREALRGEVRCRRRRKRGFAPPASRSWTTWLCEC